MNSNQLLSNALIEVYSSLGQIVYSTKVSGNNISINLDEQPNGVYIVKVNKEQNFRVVKFYIFSLIGQLVISKKKNLR